MAFKMKGFPKMETTAYKKSALKDTGHGLGNHGEHGSTADAHNVIKRANKNDPRSQKWNAEKTRKKTEKATKRKATPSASGAAVSNDGFPMRRMTVHTR